MKIFKNLIPPITVGSFQESFLPELASKNKKISLVVAFIFILLAAFAVMVKLFWSSSKSTKKLDSGDWRSYATFWQAKKELRDSKSYGTASLLEQAKKENVNLKTLISVDTDLTDDDLAEIIEVCPNISEIIFSNCEITEKSFQRLTSLKSLTSLDLRGWVNYPEKPKFLTDSVLKSIAELTGLTNLYMDGWEGVTEKGLKSLLALKNLKSLNIHDCCQVTDETAKSFAEMPNLSDLKMTISSSGGHAELQWAICGYRDKEPSSANKSGKLTLQKITEGSPKAEYLS